MFLAPIHFLSFPKGLTPTNTVLQPYETAGPPSPVQTNPTNATPAIPVIEKVNETLTTVAQTSTTESLFTEQNTTAHVDDLPISLYTIATSIWVFVAFCLFLFYAIQYFVFKRNLLVHAQPASQHTNTIYQTAAQGMNIISAPLLLVCNEVPTPMLIGFFKPYIFISNENLPENELKLILMHELTHYKHKDIPFKMVASFINILHWFNPVAWFLPSVASQVCENYCDETLSNQLTPTTRKLYSMAILHSVKPAKQALPIACTGLSIPAKKLKARIENILSFSTPTKFKKALAMCTAFVFCFSMLLVGCTVDNHSSTPETIADFSISFPVGEENLSSLNMYTSEQSTVNSSNQTISHTGVDFYADSDDPIFAVNNGIVKEVGTDILLGNYVIVDHKNGFESLYGHLNNITVAEDQEISAGDVISEGVLNSCILNNPDNNPDNLHFALLYKGANVNPYIYFESDTFYLLHPLQNSYWVLQPYIPDTEDYPGNGTVWVTGAVAPIAAMANGTVIDVGFDETDGNYVVIDHLNGYKTKYCNISEVLVDIGDSVSMGDTIACVGMTGGTLENIFTFYLYENDILIDPFLFLDTNHFTILKTYDITNNTQTYATGTMVLPLAGGSFYRSRGFYVGHSGTDLAAPYGTPIYAVDSGVVIEAIYTYEGYGVHLLIDHGGGITTLYAQCSALYVSEGDIVEQGQVIAAVGSTGWSTGNHLHFEVRVDGEPVDTAPYIGY